MTTQVHPADGRALPASGELSPAGRAAQERLFELRRELAEERGRATSDELRVTSEEGVLPPAPLLPHSPAPPLIVGASSSFLSELLFANGDKSPDYEQGGLGRHSEPLTNHLRAAAERRQRQAAANSHDWLNKLRRVRPRTPTSDELRVRSAETPRVNEPLNSSLDTRHSSLVSVHPDIALAILRRKKAAPGRVWLLLRHHDAEGRGRIPTTTAFRLLTGDGSPLRVCGRRQFANLMAAGDGQFWQRDTGRNGDEYIRLNSAARVAAGLGVTRLGGSPVAVPLSALTGRIGDVRAHLYATFHSGRTRHDPLTGEQQARGPIARSTLCKLSGAVANSQRNYERRARVGRQSAIAIGPAVGATDEHETAWRRGRALFRLRDRRGQYGRPGTVYLAWQLPNEYTGPHATLSRGRTKRLNRALADLFHNGMTGNGEQAEGSSGSVGSSQWSVVGGQWSGDGSRLVSGQSAQSPNLPISFASRRFFGTAKAAFLARDDREKYWRCSGVWLWKDEG